MTSIIKPHVLVLSSALDADPRAIVLDRPMTVAEIVATYDVRLELPTIAVSTGVAEPKPIMRGEWHVRMVRPGETLAFVPVPAGGALRSILAAVAGIALAIFAPWAAGWIAGTALGLTGTALTIGTSMIAAGIMIAGQFLINRLLPAPGGPGEAEKLYTARASSNAATPGDVIPALYGRLRYPPPFAARPYAEFDGDDQYLYQLHCMSVGHVDVERWEIGDTLVWTAADGFVEAFADDTEIEIVRPGEDVTLFPANVTTSGEVDGQTVPDDPDTLGPFAVNPPGTEIERIAVDYVFPLGLCQMDKKGRAKPYSRSVTAEYREIDAAGDPVGTWQDLFTVDHTASSRTPLRKTEVRDVAAGRYEVRFGASGADETDNDGNILNRVAWAGLRGYLHDFETPDGVTLIATKIRATEHLSSQSSGRYMFTGTRCLPTFTPDLVWTEPLPTRNPAWAAADLLRNSNYGLGLTDDEYDLAWLSIYAALFEGREDRFDALFDRAWQAGQALDAILRAGRSYHVRLGSLIGFVRDEPKAVRRAAFTPDTVVRGSIRRQDIWFSEESPDHLEVTYLDGETWRERSVMTAIGSIGSDKPQQLAMFGMTDHDHVWREGIFQTAENAYRRSFRTFQVEREGRMVVRGDPVVLHDPLHDHAGFARVEDRDGLVLVLDRAVAEPEGVWNFDNDNVGWASSNLGTGSGSLTGFVNDALLGRTIEHTGTAQGILRQAEAIECDKFAIYELQVVWRATAGAGRVRGRMAAFDSEGALLGVVGGFTASVPPEDGIQITKWYFAETTGGGVSTTWPAGAVTLRFGVDRGQELAGSAVRIGEIRVRKVSATGEHVALRDKTGRDWGPVAVLGSRRLNLLHLDPVDLAIVEAQHGTLSSALPDISQQEPAHATMLAGTDRRFDGLVVEARPVGDYWEVTLVNDDPRVYQVDNTEPIPSPWVPPPRLPAIPDTPIISGLYAHAVRGVLGVHLEAAWRPSPGADRYFAEINYDENAALNPATASWLPAHDSAATRFTMPIQAQVVTLRVSALGLNRGPWVYLTVLEVPEPELPPEILPPESPDPPTDFAILAAHFRLVTLTWVNTVNPLLSHVDIWFGETNQFDDANHGGSFRGEIGSVTVPESGKLYYFWAKSVSIFGRESAAVGPVSTTASDQPPAKPTGLVLTSIVDPLRPGFSIVTATWNANSEADLAYYDLNVKEGSGEFVSRTVGTNRDEFRVRSGTALQAKVRAVPQVGPPSLFSDVVPHTAAADNVAPAVPSGVSALGGFGVIWTKWNRNTEGDLSHYEVFEQATATPAPTAGTAATFTTLSNQYPVSGLTGIVTRHYWVRAVDISGNKSAWSARAQATTVEVDAQITTEKLVGLVDATSFASSIAVPGLGTTLPATPFNAQTPKTFYKMPEGVLYKQNAAGNGWIAVTDASLIVGQLIAGQIGAGAIGAEQLQAKAITVEKLAVTAAGNALNADPNFEDATFWQNPTVTDLTIQRWTNVVYAGAQALRIQGTGSAYWQQSKIPVDPEKTYLLRLVMRRVGNIDGTVYGTVQFWDASGNLITDTPASGWPGQHGATGRYYFASAVTPPLSYTSYSLSVGAGGSAAIPSGAVSMSFAILAGYGGTGTSDLRLGWWSISEMMRGELIVDGAITSQKLTTGELITLSAQIKNAIITNGHILNLDADKITTGELDADRIGVGTLTANKIRLGGSTTLASWQMGGDETRMNGGWISANTIDANKLRIGQRNVTLEGIDFEHNSPANNRCSWTAGTIRYVNDAGVLTSVSLLAGSTPVWSSGAYYIYWVKDALNLSYTANSATAHSANNVVLAVYRGGTNLDANYGRTIIDGSNIKTGSIDAQQIKVDAVRSQHIQTGAVNAGHVQAGSINTGHLVVGGNGGSVQPDPYFIDENLWLNPSSQSGTYSLSYITTQTYVGGKALRMLSSSAGSKSIYWDQHRWPVDFGRSYYISLLYRRVTGNGRLYGVFRFYDVNGNLITGQSMPGWPGQNTGAGNYYSPSNLEPNSTGWRRDTFTFGLEGAGQMPPAASFMSFGILFEYGGTVANSDWRFNELTIREMTRGDLIVNGSILAQHVNADSLFSVNAAISGTLTIGAGITISGPAGRILITD